MVIEAWVFIGVVLVGTVISFKVAKHWRYGLDWDDFAFGVVVSFGIGLVVCTLVAAIGPQFSQKPEMVSSHSLVALTNNSEISGSFFLASGRIGERDVYTYMYETEDGGRIMDEVNVASVALYETDEEPRIERVEDCTDLNFLVPCEPTINPQYRMYISKGSIWYGYDVDVRND